MTDTLTSGGRIEIRGFGSFVVKDYQAYMGRNPKTGEVIKVVITSYSIHYTKLYEV